MFDPRNWLQSGEYAIVDGLPLRPCVHPALNTLLLSASMGQAIVYFLLDDAGHAWMLKRFRPGKVLDPDYLRALEGLIPREPGFESGFQRRCLTSSMVSSSGYSSAEFVAWIDGTVLMPRVKAADWSRFLAQHRDSVLDLTLPERTGVAEELCRLIGTLDHAGLAHRDLSATNVMIDDAYVMHLIDWDALYAPSLQMPSNTVAGTDGYIAPWIYDASGDARVTWTAGADRFALSVLILETFAAGPGCGMNGDGGLLAQNDINMRVGSSLDEACAAAKTRAPHVVRLFEMALSADGPLRCPSPADWRRCLRNPRAAAPRPDPRGFVVLNHDIFVRLKRSHLVPTIL